MIKLFFIEFYNLFIDMAPYLLIGLIFVGILHVFIKEQFITKHIGKNNILSIVKASLLGVPLPLCSCGVLPMAIQLKKNGASNGAVISFLISTPQTGVDSIIATYGLLGLPFAIFRPFAALISGIIGGVLINIFVKEELNFGVNDKSTTCNSDTCHSHDNNENEIHLHSNKVSVSNKIKNLFKYAFGEFLDDISVHFLIGLVVATFITIMIPNDFFEKLGLNSGLISMIIMIVIGLPMYICSTSSIPIAIVLLIKGFSPGAAFVFLFVGPVTNAASIAMLSKTLGKKLTSLYLLVVALLAIAFGYLLDLIFNIMDLKVQLLSMINNKTKEEKSILLLVLAAIFFIIFVRSLFNNIYKKKHDM